LLLAGSWIIAIRSGQPSAFNPVQKVFDLIYATDLRVLVGGVSAPRTPKHKPVEKPE